MNFRNMLIGSVATLAAIPAARAADAIVMAEPEPVEYVRVCDAYGSGFFYIPGTETCLRISGYVRYQIGATNDDGLAAGDTPNYYGYANGWNKTTRARINFDARSDTEWGTLRAFVRYQASWGTPNDGPARADQAWLSLGGLRMGYSESLWADSVFDLSVSGSHSDGGLWYGDQQRHFVQYNFGGGTGFFGSVSLEDDALSGDGYMPDIVGLAGFQQRWGGLWARVGYDESYGILGDDGFGVSAGLQINAGESGSFRLIGYYADGDHDYGTGSSYAGISGGNGNAEWSVLGSYYHQFTPSFGGSIGAQYFSDYYAGGTDISTGLDGYIAEASLVWEPVDNLEIRTEAVYEKVDGLDGTVSGFLWFKRSF
ncbi:MAG: porin [Rhizobiaceae bacterium]|nr:porin [Rhizobiaceae bacterium]MCV0405386.1 porin [Rhizobiaceae bacterium]